MYSRQTPERTQQLVRYTFVVVVAQFLFGDSPLDEIAFGVATSPLSGSASVRKWTKKGGVQSAGVRRQKKK